MNYSLNISGRSAYLALPNNSAYLFGTGDFTLQCWIKTTASGTVISRRGNETSMGTGGFLLVVKPNGTIKLTTDNGFDYYEINTVPTAICNGSWHFLTAVRRSNGLTIYLNGQLISFTASHIIPLSININNKLPIYLGAAAQVHESHNQFTGLLDEVRIWNIALSETQIQNQMNQLLTGLEEGLIGYYNFQNQNGNDVSRTANHATTVGSINYTSSGALVLQTPYIDQIKQAVNGYFNHLSGPAYVRILDTPHVWGMPFGPEIMPQAHIRQAEFERGIVEIVQKTKYRCDLSSLNSPDPDWVKVILGAIDTCLTTVMGRTQPTQFRFLFGQTPTVPIGEPAHYTDFKAALIRLIRERSEHWEVMPEIWMGRFYRLGQGIISTLQAKVFGSAIIGSDDTKMTWNHTKIICMDGTEALVGGHNLNMDLFKSYPPVHDVSIQIHGEAAYGSQLFLNQMWACTTELLTKESLKIDTLNWINKDREQLNDPLSRIEAITYMKNKQDLLISLHKSGVQPRADLPYFNGQQPMPSTIRLQDLQTLTDLQLKFVPERIVYHNYDGFAQYKLASRMLALGKYWNGPTQSTDFLKASELMKEKLIKSAKHTIRLSQMDIVSAWKKNWSDHKVCQWIIQALLDNKNLKVQIVVSPLDAGAGVAGDQYSFGSGASRTFDLLKYYMTHDAATDIPLDDSDGSRAQALKRLSIAPLYYTDQVPPDKTFEGKTYQWPHLSPEGYTATLKQPPLLVKPPVRGVIGSAALSVINASGYLYKKVPSAPGNHAKIMIVDDEAYVVGSDNLYPGFLSEVNYIVEGKDAVNELIQSYWTPLWKYSSPYSISGT